MYDVSDLWLNALRFGGGTWYGYVEAWYSGERITLPDGSTHLPLKLDGQNEVRVDGATSGGRRRLSLTLPREVGLWDALAPVGTELRAYTAIRHQSGGTEVVPQGVFDVDVQSLGYSAGGDLQITAPDRWAKIQRANFLTPRAATAGATNRAQIATLLNEVTGGSASDEATSTATVPAQTWDRDRAGAIEALAKAASLDVFFDRSGTAIIRDVATLQPTGVWTVDAGPTGVMVGADRQRDRQRTFNIVVVTSSRNDGVAPFAPQYVWDNNPLSPTYAGPGSGASATPPTFPGWAAAPFGQRAIPYDSPLLLTTTQARAAGATILAKVSGLNAQLNVSAVPNTALDDGDTIAVTFPRERWDRHRVTERHIVDSFTVPLVWHRTPMQISTRSTVADLD
jgi:kumamolisin